MGKKVLIDSRWAGNTGIGRLYKEVMQKVPTEVSCSFISNPMGLGNLFSPIMLANEIRKSSAEIFYSPSFMGPAYSKIPYIFTIHDLMHLFYYSKMHSIYYKQVISRLARNAQQIITVSSFSKNLLINHLGIKSDLISVIYNGVDTMFLDNVEETVLDRPYFLYVGNRRINKNIPTMLRAFSKASISNDFIFVLTGNPDKNLGILIKRLGIEKRVRFLGFVPEENLPKLYRGAFATMFVSLMEGFGLPLIESMASATPVLTSSTGALPEISGDAALCVDPQNIDAIKYGIEKLVDDSSFYEACVIKGLERAKEFSWESTAKSTWDLILSQ